MRTIYRFAAWAFALAMLTPTLEGTAFVENGRSTCAILLQKDDAALRRTATQLAEYFELHTGTKPAIVDADHVRSVVEPTLIVLDASNEHVLLKSLGIAVDVPGDRDDAYHLLTVSAGSKTIVAAAARTPAGAKYAAYRLMEEMEIARGSASVGALNLSASPFFKTRSVSLFNIWRVPVEVIRQCNLESWPAEKVKQNIDTYDAFGFNAVETHDRFHEDFLKAVYGISRAEWRQKVYALCDRAHEDGMTVFLRQWGNSVALPVKELKGGYTPFGFDNLAPDLPAERKRWEAEIRDYSARNYAAHIDHLIGHWADAGGIHDGSNATVKDSMLLHNELVDAFRAINPNIQSSFNLWGMANPHGIRGWPGYTDHRSICDAGILPKDVAIAQTTRAESIAYSEKETADILAAGHPAAVWTWRRADTEVRLGDCGLRIRIHGVLGDYFHDLPESARALSWHNIERNHHGLANDVNYYIAGKLMWDPKTDVDAVLAKYCELVFGKANVPAMAEAFDTIEMARHVEKQVSDEMVAHPAEGASRAKAALAAVTKIRLPADHRSRLPSVTSPQEMLDQIRGTLAVIAENGQIIAEQLPALRLALKDGKREEAVGIAAAVKAKADAWFGTVAGGVEGLWLRETLPGLTLTAMPAAQWKESFGTQTLNVDLLQQKDDRFKIVSTAGELGYALFPMKTAARRHAEFHFQFNPAPAGKIKNGGFVFGASTDPEDLVRCQVYLSGPFIRIRGNSLAKPVKLDIRSVDPKQAIDCTASVDLEKKTITFKAAGVEAEARLKKSEQVAWYGYAVENTASDFGPIEVRDVD